jgi:uncharacterized membrane protein (GlpM family)
MKTQLLTQMLVSFITGGGLITLLSLIAEKTNQRISGIILTFPSTLVIGFFFLGLSTGTDNVAKIVPTTIIPLGILVLSSLIYTYVAVFFAKYLKNNVHQILCSLLTSTVFWFLLVSPFAICKVSNLLYSILGFAIIVFISHLIVKSNIYDSDLKPLAYTAKQILFRAIFTGTIIAAIVFCAKTLNPFWGGIFTMFPAATFSTLTILHYHYKPAELFHFVKKIPLGSVSLLIYAVSVMYFFPKLGIYQGTMISCFLSLLFTFTVVKGNIGHTANSLYKKTFFSKQK